MAYDPAEFNNPYTDESLEKEFGGLANRAMDPEEKAKIKQEFLGLLAAGATASKALSVINGSDQWYGAKTSRVGRKTIYSWRKYEPDFKQDWDEAYAIGTEKFEQRAAEFAIEGNASLMMFQMKTRNPQRYGIQKQEISGPAGGALQIERIEIVGVDTDQVDDGSSPTSTASKT